MPHVDFGRAFENLTDAKPFSPAADEPPVRAANAATPREPLSRRQARLGRSDWANIIFVIITVLGGLFCAFYFFNGAELMRSLADWPRELLYGRPPEPMFTKIDNYAPLPPANISSAQRGSESEPGPFRQSAAELLGLDTPRQPAFAAVSPINATTAPAAPIGSGGSNAPLQQLAGPLPDGDALTRALVADAAASRSAATAVVKNVTAIGPVSQSTRSVATATNKLVRQVKPRSVTRTSSAVTSNAAANANQSSARSTMSQSSFSGVRGLGGVGGINGSGGGLGGIGGINGGSSAGGGLGGVSGINGGGIGGGGGAIGGLNGALHGGLLGGRH